MNMMWWKFEDIKSVHFINEKKDIPYKEFLLANVDWEEWPGGAAEIESAYLTQRETIEELFKLILDSCDPTDMTKENSEVFFRLHKIYHPENYPRPE